MALRTDLDHIISQHHAAGIGGGEAGGASGGGGGTTGAARRRTKAKSKFAMLYTDSTAVTRVGDGSGGNGLAPQMVRVTLTAKDHWMWGASVDNLTVAASEWTDEMWKEAWRLWDYWCVLSFPNDILQPWPVELDVSGDGLDPLRTLLRFVVEDEKRYMASVGKDFYVDSVWDDTPTYRAAFVSQVCRINTARS